MSEPTSYWNAPRGTTMYACKDGEYATRDDYVRLEQECERLRLDAERYRLYRQGMENPEAFDAGVDAALSAKP